MGEWDNNFVLWWCNAALLSENEDHRLQRLLVNSNILDSDQNLTYAAEIRHKTTKTKTILERAYIKIVPRIAGKTLPDR